MPFAETSGREAGEAGAGVGEVPALLALTHPQRIVAGVCFLPEENDNVVQPSTGKF